jgi:hypothetical protein
MSQDKPPEGNERFYAAMSMDPALSPDMQRAKAIAILHAEIRRVPEQIWPGRSQQFTTHSYIADRR